MAVRSRRPCCSADLLLLAFPLLPSILLSVCQGNKLFISPNRTNLYVKEGNPLEFTCDYEEINQIQLIFPGVDNNLTREMLHAEDLKELSKSSKNGTSAYKISWGNSSLFDGKNIVFRRPSTVLGDSGWYGCVVPSEIRRMFVNVTSKNNSDSDDCGGDSSMETTDIADAENDSDDGYVYDDEGEYGDGDGTYIDVDRSDTTIIPGSKPKFNYVNMNGTEVAIKASEAQSAIYLSCIADGIPKPTITWYRNDDLLEINKQQFSLDSSNQTLTIKYFKEKDSGRYSCIAKNRWGEIQQFQNFIVIDEAEVSELWIIGIVVIIIIILAALLIYLFIKIKCKRNKDLIKMSRQQSIEADLTHFEDGIVDCINPELTVDEQAELLPYYKKWEFPREKLKLGRQLGSGEFGVVMKAEARGIQAKEKVTTVAVKMVRRNVESAYIRALIGELKIMVHLGKHLNVVNLLGACTSNIVKRELLVIVEFCRYGNLHNYLLRHRDNFINEIDPKTGKIDPSVNKETMVSLATLGSGSGRLKCAELPFSQSHHSDGSASGTETVIYTSDNQDVTGLSSSGSVVTNTDNSQPGWPSNYRGDYKDRNGKSICTQDLLSWAFQVARGMEYLFQRKVLHGDLAARNVLLAENNVVKICDFGLAKKIYKDANYQKKSKVPLPIKWMAIESIRDRIFSTQSDVWSFGIVLWEFFTLAETPYPGMQAEKQYRRLLEGYRMEQPQYATQDLYDIMLQCWKEEPTLRPSFSDLVDSIGKLLEDSVKTHYVEMNAPYENFNASLECDYLKMMSAPDHATLTTSQRDQTYYSPWISTVTPYLSNNSSNSLDESGIFSSQANSAEDLYFRVSSPTSPSYC